MEVSPNAFNASQCSLGLFFFVVVQRVCVCEGGGGGGGGVVKTFNGDGGCVGGLCGGCMCVCVRECGGRVGQVCGWIVCVYLCVCGGRGRGLFVREDKPVHTYIHVYTCVCAYVPGNRLCAQLKHPQAAKT